MYDFKYTKVTILKIITLNNMRVITYICLCIKIN